MNGSASQQRGIDMNYKAQAQLLHRHYIDNVEGIIFQRLDVICKDCALAADSIRTLLERAEAAEADRDRLREAMKPNCLLCDSMHENGNCTEVGGFCTAVPAAHCPLIPKLRDKVAEAEARAEKAEKCITEIEEALKFQRYSAAVQRIFEYCGKKEK